MSHFGVRMRCCVCLREVGVYDAKGTLRMRWHGARKTIGCRGSTMVALPLAAATREAVR